MNSKIISSLALIAVLAGIIFTACERPKPNKQVEQMRHVDWSKNANIYEVNIRQYTPEGTINAFRKHLPRLHDIGVDILWIMPVQPIGKENRKGSLGSYYSIQNYDSVNPEFGTMDDFKALVNEAHKMGMHVILDWVANHSSWDNVWTKSDSNFYEKDSTGKFVSPYDWSDVISLNYDNPAMRDSMIDAMAYWVKETNIDGFRCDVAGMVPTDFWNQAVAKLDSIKPLFMLAEDEKDTSLLTHAFDMNYTWEMHHLMNDIAQGKKKASALWKNLEWNDSTFSPDVYRMYFTSNHDENSWNGTTNERMGKAANAFAVLAYTLPGMPLVYSGQEAENNKRLRFFEKDTIDWSKIPLAGFYKTLNQLKTDNKALWNGNYGGTMIPISKDQNENVFAFERKKGDNRVLVILNLSAKKQPFTIDSNSFDGNYTNIFTGEKVSIKKDDHFQLNPWEYIVLTDK